MRDCGLSHDFGAPFRTRLARGDSADLCGLFDWKVDRRGWQGIYDVLEVETRGFTGRRVYDTTGLPLHFDNQSIFKERIYREPSNPNILQDEITVIDHALTRPWTVDKKYLHNPNPHPNWIIGSCGESSMLVAIGREAYVVSADGLLMPIKKEQATPDLRYFKQEVKQPQH
jgi:hypothetical protein